MKAVTICHKLKTYFYFLLFPSAYSSGIIEFWYEQIEYAIKINIRYHRTRMPSDTAKAFKLADMQTAFYILFIGLVVSTLVLMGECIVARRAAKYTPFKFTP